MKKRVNKDKQAKSLRFSKSNNTVKHGVAPSQMLTLEPRIMLDAAALAAGADIVVDTSPTVDDSTGLQLPDTMDSKPDSQDEAKNQTNEAEDESQVSQYEPPAVQGENRQGIELVIVDKSIADYQSLIAGVLELDTQGDTANHDRMIEIITLDSGSNGILQITNALENYDNISAVHIFFTRRQWTVAFRKQRTQLRKFKRRMKIYSAVGMQT